ncbi:hypothetical protein NDU88_005906 [Pleurodeles waltl]|uniref:Uncharacterized protein n=1 Tax=Pleurodeles waltl TaxID=8319 RepID=A0AAV7PJC6_PLEWA|nr:hypothetical protein NDU88_005906 [Pleurodeles waltl]
MSTPGASPTETWKERSSGTWKSGFPSKQKKDNGRGRKRRKRRGQTPRTQTERGPNHHPRAAKADTVDEEPLVEAKGREDLEPSLTTMSLEGSG